MSVRVTRSAVIAARKMKPGIAFAHEIGEYVEANYRLEVWLGAEVGGTVRGIQWQIEYEGLGALEEFTRKTAADEGYWAMIANAGDVLEGSPTDSIAISV